MPDIKTIGRRLRELRGEKSREEAARNIGVSSSALGMYESGHRTPRDEVKIAIAAYYGCPVQEIFFT